MNKLRQLRVYYMKTFIIPYPKCTWHLQPHLIDILASGWVESRVDLDEMGCVPKWKMVC